MSVPVYHFDMNPNVEARSYRLSNARADETVKDGQGEYFTLEDGRKAIRLYRKKSYVSETWLERFKEIDPPSTAIPSHELPGIYFEEPQSATWREQHRATRTWA